MIDNTEKTAALMGKMKAALPMGAGVTARAHEALRAESPDLAIPRRCEITTIYYFGDEGGIVCTLDLPDTKNAHIISITHLTFGRGDPLSREIRAYQKHRIRRLRRLDGRRF
ncbi:MAG: hypothetical protein IIA73_03605 [Proteobacteria bacterium]|nr:hypothetical protein [Pseudomonadota bacterium]